MTRVIRCWPWDESPWCGHSQCLMGVRSMGYEWDRVAPCEQQEGKEKESVWRQGEACGQGESVGAQASLSAQGQ